MIGLIVSGILGSLVAGLAFWGIFFPVPKHPCEEEEVWEGWCLEDDDCPEPDEPNGYCL